MDDPLLRRTWLGRFAYILIALALIFIKLLPLSTTPGGLPGPDLVLAITYAWLFRRPEQIPAVSIVLVFFVFDMVFLKAPALWTLIMLGSTEFLRSRLSHHSNMPFLAEWSVVAVLLSLAILSEQLLLSVFILPRPGLGIALLQGVFTLLAYPIVVVVLRFGLGLRNIAPGEVYDTGRKL